MKFKLLLILFLLQNWAGLAQRIYFSSTDTTPSVEIYFVNKNLFDLLYLQQIDFAKLYNERCLVEPKSLNECYLNILISLRGGVPNKAIEALKQMKNKYPRLQRLPDLYYKIKEHNKPKVLKTLIGLYPIELQQYLLEYLKHLYTEEKWSFDKIINWLDNLPLTNKNTYFLEGSFFSVYRSINPILLLKKDFYKWANREKVFIATLIDSIKNNRSDDLESLEYLDVLCSMKFYNYGFDLKWVTNNIQPKHSTDIANVAFILGYFGYFEEALQYYELAQKTKLTDYDYSNLNWGLSNRVPNERLKKSHESSIIKQMTELQIKMGKKEKAHATMMTDKNILDVSQNNYDFNHAGSVQGRTGIYKVEKNILRSERKNRKKLQYWKNRSSYYYGRDNYKKADMAVLKAIKLLKKRYSKDTLYLISDYEELLMRHHYYLGEIYNQKTAFNFFHKELKSTPLSSNLASSIVFDMFDTNNREYDVDVWDNLYWEFALANNNWPDNFISRMLSDCQPNEKDTIFSLLEEYAKNNVERSRCLAYNGTVQAIYPKEAIKLFLFVRNIKERKMGELDEDDNWEKHSLKNQLDYINENLVELYMKINDFENAGATLGKINDMDAVKDYAKKMAILLAQQGKVDESFKAWSRINNLDPSNMVLLEELCKYPMKDNLVNYYNKMQKELPESEIPHKALLIINKK